MSAETNTNYQIAIWSYQVMRDEVESQIGRYLDSEEWYALEERLDEAVLEVLSKLGAKDE